MTAPDKYVSDRFLMDRYDIARATVWRWVHKKRLPPPVKVSDNITRWIFGEVLAYERLWLVKREEAVAAAHGETKPARLRGPARSAKRRVISGEAESRPVDTESAMSGRAAR